MQDRVSVSASPPLFVQLAANPLRWRLLTALSSTDLRVRELCAIVGQPQNVVSYHLARLRAGGLVTSQRSSADGRDSYYHLDLARCGALLEETASAVHPALARPSAATASSRKRSRLASGEPVRVLFLCTGNSARSQIAGALLASRGGDRVAVDSAGSHPKQINPLAVRLMRRYNIDLSAEHSKPLSLFTHRCFDYVISLCDRVREVCPEFPGRPVTLHWSIPDPASAGDQRAAGRALRAVADELIERIEFLLVRILPTAA